MVRDILGREQGRGVREHRALAVRGDAAGHDKPDAALRAFGVERRYPAPVSGLFKAGMHGAHDGPVPELDKSEIERLEKPGELLSVHSGAACRSRGAWPQMSM